MAEVVGILLDTCLVRGHRTALVQLLPRLRSKGIELGVPAPMFAELLHQRALVIAARLGEALLPDGLLPEASAGLEALSSRAPVLPFARSDAEALARWSADAYGSPAAWRRLKKRMAVRSASDAFSRGVHRSMVPDLGGKAWLRRWNREVFPAVEACATEETLSKTSPGTIDWLLVGMAVARGWHIATNEVAGAEFEHVQPWVLRLEDLKKLAGGKDV